jgi:hypothetical protein
MLQIGLYDFYGGKSVFDLHQHDWTGSEAKPASFSVFNSV